MKSGRLAELDALQRPDWAAIGGLLQMRARVRGRPEAMALVDRCLDLVTRAATADDRAFAALMDEVRRLSDDLAARFGAPSDAVRH